MSQRGVEIVVGRLATDEALRERFERAALATLRELEREGVELSAVEQQALQGLDIAALERFSRALDPRLQKAMLTGHEANG